MNVAILSINLHTKKLNYGAVLHSWYFQKLMLKRADVAACDIIWAPNYFDDGFDPAFFRAMDSTTCGGSPIPPAWGTRS